MLLKVKQTLLGSVRLTRSEQLSADIGKLLRALRGVNNLPRQVRVRAILPMLGCLDFAPRVFVSYKYHLYNYSRGTNDCE